MTQQELLVYAFNAVGKSSSQIDKELYELLGAPQQNIDYERTIAMLKDKISQSDSLIADLKEQLRIAEKTLNAFSSHDVQCEKVHNGLKIAYKKEVSPQEVKRLLDEKYTISQIADKLNTSVSTINRRIKDLKAIESSKKHKE